MWTDEDSCQPYIANYITGITLREMAHSANLHMC